MAECLPPAHVDDDRFISLGIIISVYLGSDNAGSMEGNYNHGQVEMSTRNLLFKKKKKPEELCISLFS